MVAPYDRVAAYHHQLLVPHPSHEQTVKGVFVYVGQMAYCQGGGGVIASGRKPFTCNCRTRKGSRSSGSSSRPRPILITVSQMLTALSQTLGDAVHQHYLHFFRTEWRAYEQAVTDWDRKRYFERI